MTYQFADLLTILIHIIIVVLVVAAGDIVEPLLIVEIPFHSLLNTLFKLKTWLPTEFLLEFSRVDCIARIVARTIRNIGDEVQVLPFLTTEKPVNGVYYYLYDINVLPLVETADVSATLPLGNMRSIALA